VRHLCALLLVLAACPAQGGDDYPIGPGGGSSGTNSGSGRRDAAVDDAGDGGTLIIGRVCLIDDLRQLSACSGNGAGDLTVTLGSATATTNVDGQFSIAAPAATNVVWHVTGQNIIPSVMPLSPVHQIPVINDELYGQLLSGNSVVLQDGQGTLVAHLIHNNVAAVGATAILDPATANDTFYDGNNPLVWATTATGSFGVTWLPGADVGTVQITATLGAAQVTATYPIENQAITFAEIEIP
jgi:hypothetical protein